MSKSTDKFYYSQQFGMHGFDQTQDLGMYNKFNLFFFIETQLEAFCFKCSLFFISEFHSFFQNEISQFDNQSHLLPSSTLQRNSLSPVRKNEATVYENDEPPLLEELEIYPERIVQKSLAILNPFHAGNLSNDTNYLFNDTDLAGPIIFCLMFGICLFVSGSKVHFGYIYGLSLISVFGMYVLVTLMCHQRKHFISLVAVASALGYGILPIVWLSMLGIFLSLNSAFGFLIACAAVYLSTVGTSRLFCLMTSNMEQRVLLAYPCALIYTVFAILALF